MEKKKRGFVRWLVPAFIFKSIVIGGGYGTGAEIREFYLSQGFLGGVLAALVTMVVWSVLCAVTFEFVRTFKTFDYRSLISKLIGKAAFLYEICYITMLLLVLGVVNSTASNMVADLTGAPGWIGVALLSCGIILLVLKGSETIEKVLSFWSYVLYAIYFLFMVLCFVRFGDNIAAQWRLHEVGEGWLLSGAKYSFYNLCVIPCLLYTIRDCESRKEAVVEGLLAGLVGVIPAVLLLIVLAGCMPASFEAEVPVTAVFAALDLPWLYWAFEIVLFGTLIETGTGFTKAVDDRIERSILEKRDTVPGWVRPATAFGTVLAGVGVAQFGLTSLISKGYGTLCWGFLLFFALPICTIGIYKIKRAGKTT